MFEGTPSVITTMYKRQKKILLHLGRKAGEKIVYIKNDLL